MSTCCSLKIWILFLWAEKLQIKQSRRWFICSGESVFLQNFIDISEKKKIYLSQRSRCWSSWCARDSSWIYQSGKRKSLNAATVSGAIQRHISVHLLAHFSWNLHHIREKRHRSQKQFSHLVQSVLRQDVDATTIDHEKSIKSESKRKRAKSIKCDQ